mgnify:FL=1
MEDLHIEGTKRTPEIRMKATGEITIEGRSVMEDAPRFYDALFLWVFEYSKNPAEQTVINVNLEYSNSDSAIAILHLLKVLAQLKNQNKSLIVNWYYEQGDDDVLERGQYYASILGIPFQFIELE